MDGAGGVLGDGAAIAVGAHLPMILPAALRVFEVLDVVADGQHQLIGDKMLVHQLQRQRIGHLVHHQAGHLAGIGAGEHLPGAYTVRFRLVSLDVGDGTGLPSPGVVDQQLGVDTEHLV